MKKRRILPVIFAAVVVVMMMNCTCQQKLDRIFKKSDLILMV